MIEPIDGLPPDSIALSSHPTDQPSDQIVRPTAKTKTKEEMAEILKSRGITFGIYPSKHKDGRDGTGLKPYKDQIEQVGLTALVEIANEMPIRNIDIKIYDEPIKPIPGFNIKGYAFPVGRELEIDIDSKLTDCAAVIREEFRRSLRHEAHHKMRYAAFHRGLNLWDDMVEEGLACWYEQGSDENPPIYAIALTPEQQKAMLVKVRDEYDVTDRTRREEWYFGSKENDIPRWTLYTLGYKIVGEYLKTHPGKKPSDLYAVPAEEFRQYF